MHLFLGIAASYFSILMSPSHTSQFLRLETPESSLTPPFPWPLIPTGFYDRIRVVKCVLEFLLPSCPPLGSRSNFSHAWVIQYLWVTVFFLCLQRRCLNVLHILHAYSHFDTCSHISSQSLLKEAHRITLTPISSPLYHSCWCIDIYWSMQASCFSLYIFIGQIEQYQQKSHHNIIHISDVA